MNSRMLRRAREAGEAYGRKLLEWYEDKDADVPMTLMGAARNYPQLTLRAAFLTGVARAIEAGAWEELA